MFDVILPLARVSLYATHQDTGRGEPTGRDKRRSNNGKLFHNYYFLTINSQIVCKSDPTPFVLCLLKL